MRFELVLGIEVSQILSCIGTGIGIAFFKNCPVDTDQNYIGVSVLLKPNQPLINTDFYI